MTVLTTPGSKRKQLGDPCSPGQ